MLGTVTVILVVVFAAGLVWASERRAERRFERAERAADTYRQTMVELFNSAQENSARSTREAVRAVAEVAKATNPVASPQRGLTEQEVARELYEQGIVPAYNDPTDDSDPSDLDPWLAVAREPVVVARADDPNPFGVDGMVVGNSAQIIHFPPPPPPSEGFDPHDIS